MAKKTTPAKEPSKAAGKAGKQTARQAGVAGDDASIEQVRELLFGEQARRLDQRFAQLEQRLDDAFAKLEERLQSSDREHSADSSKLRGELRSFRQDSENRLAAAEDEWQGQLRDADQRLRGELKQLQNKLHSTAAQLGDDKAGRAQLAELLNNLAAQLVQDADS